MAYADLGDFYTHGLRSVALVAEPRPAKLIDPTTDRLVVPSHGLKSGHPVSIEARGGVVPAPLTALLVVYFAEPVLGSDDILQLTATPGGAAIDLTNAGTGVVVVVPQVTPFVLDSLEAWSSYLDDELVTHAAPLTTWPLVVTQIVCWLAAYDVAITKGLLNPSFKDSSQGLKDKFDLALKKIEGWKAGRSIVGATDQTGSEPDDAAVILQGDAPRDWFSSGRLL